MLTVKQAAKYLGLSPVRVSVFCQEGKIKAEKRQLRKDIKKQWVISKEALDDFLAQRKQPGLVVDFEEYDLTSNERQMLSLRQNKTLAHVGKIMGFSRQRAHQLQERALEKNAAHKDIDSSQDDH